MHAHHGILTTKDDDTTPERITASGPWLTGARAHLALCRALDRSIDAIFSVDDSGLRVWDDQVVFAATIAPRRRFPFRETFLVKLTDHQSIHVRAVDYADLIHTEMLDS